MNDLKSKISEVYQIIENQNIRITKINHYEEKYGIVYFYNEDNQMIMMMPSEDWQDILKNERK